MQAITTRITTIAMVAAGVLACVAGAKAADMPGWKIPPAYEPPPPPKFQELLSGWYLRGDIGYRINSVGSIDSTVASNNLDWSNAVSASFGWGYKYQWFRAEISVDRGMPTRVTSTTSVGAQPQYSAKIGTLSGMVNGYIDMGTWSGFTPYIGVGAGVTQIKSDNFSDTSLPGGVVAWDGSVVTAPGKATNFTWAAMAGVAFQVAPQWMIDVGYRYMSMGNVGAVDGAGSSNPAPVFKNLTTQEVRLGVRFLFD